MVILMATMEYQIYQWDFDEDCLGYNGIEMDNMVN